jgi:hypothetical protein
MAERVFAEKLEKVGFEKVWIGERIPMGIEQVALYPLFTPEFVELMRKVIPPEGHDCVATSVIVKARKPK